MTHDEQVTMTEAERVFEAIYRSGAGLSRQSYQNAGAPNGDTDEGYERWVAETRARWAIEASQRPDKPEPTIA